MTVTKVMAVAFVAGRACVANAGDEKKTGRLATGPAPL